MNLRHQFYSLVVKAGHCILKAESPITKMVHSICWKYGQAVLQFGLRHDSRTHCKQCKISITMSESKTCTGWCYGCALEGSHV